MQLKKVNALRAYFEQLIARMGVIRRGAGCEELCPRAIYEDKIQVLEEALKLAEAEALNYDVKISSWLGTFYNFFSHKEFPEYKKCAQMLRNLSYVTCHLENYFFERKNTSYDEVMIFVCGTKSFFSPLFEPQKETVSV